MTTTYTPQVYLQIDNITSGSPVLVSRYQNFNLTGSVTYGGNSYTFAPFEVADFVQQRSASQLAFNITFPGQQAFVDLLETVLFNGKYKFTVTFTCAEILPAVFTTVTGIATGGSSDFFGVTFQISDGLDATEAQIPTRKVTYDQVPFDL
jgi:hypothetical protein